MRKTEKNLYLIYMIFAVSLVTANCIASKMFNTGITLFGAPVALTTGAICYPVTFLCTDIIGEMWGKQHANIAVKYGFVVQIFSTLVIILARYMPASDMAMQDAFVRLLGQNWAFALASLTAYGCSQSWDVFAFHKIRTWYLHKHGSTKGGKWLWNNGSTMTSQLIDSIVYVLVAFGFGFGWLFDVSMHQTMINMILAQWMFKVILAALDTPVFYFLTRKADTTR